MTQESGSARKRKRSPEGVSPERTQQLDKRLLAYALAGAGAVSFAPAASAEIVYTQADVTLSHGTLAIDLNHDGIDDFSIQNYASGYSSFYDVRVVVGSPNASAAVIGRKIVAQGTAWAAPLNWPIGKNSPKGFVNLRPPALMAQEGCVATYCWPPNGPWADTVHKFLGMRFKINGEVHYGWARFTVRGGFFVIKAKLTGYAYETDPDKTILAGDRGSASDASLEGGKVGDADIESAPTQPSPSLGLLSLGSAGLDLWRRPQ